MGVHKVRLFVSATALSFTFAAADAGAQTLATPLTGLTNEASQTADGEVSEGGRRRSAAQQSPACRRILKACKQAGFAKGQAKQDKGVRKDCFDPIVKGTGSPTLNGKPITVSVNPQDVQACAATHTFNRNRRGQSSPE